MNYNEIASTGHSSTQAPHSVHVSASMTAFSSSVIASTGQTSTHAPQAMHVSLSNTAGMKEGNIKPYKAFSSKEIR